MIKLRKRCEPQGNRVREFLDLELKLVLSCLLFFNMFLRKDNNPTHLKH